MVQPFIIYLVKCCYYNIILLYIIIECEISNRNSQTPHSFSLCLAALSKAALHPLENMHTLNHTQLSNHTQPFAAGVMRIRIEKENNNQQKWRQGSELIEKIELNRTFHGTFARTFRFRFRFRRAKSVDTETSPRVGLGS